MTRERGEGRNTKEEKLNDKSENVSCLRFTIIQPLAKEIIDGFFDVIQKVCSLGHTSCLIRYTQLGEK